MAGTSDLQRNLLLRARAAGLRKSRNSAGWKSASAATGNRGDDCAPKRECAGRRRTGIYGDSDRKRWPERGRELEREWSCRRKRHRGHDRADKFDHCAVHRSGKRADTIDCHGDRDERCRYDEIGKRKCDDYMQHAERDFTGNCKPRSRSDAIIHSDFLPCGERVHFVGRERNRRRKFEFRDHRVDRRRHRTVYRTCGRTSE